MEQYFYSNDLSERDLGLKRYRPCSGDQFYRANACKCQGPLVPYSKTKGGQMDKWIIALIGIMVIAGAMWLILCLCKAASMADDQKERMDQDEQRE